MTVRFYNSLTHQQEDFAPQTPGPAAQAPLRGAQIRMYTCGPTVYDYAHIGNFRSFLFADVLRRHLEWHGATVRQVMNMTDVGHMTQDQTADGAGRDKLELAVEKMKQSKKSGAALVENPNDPGQVADFFVRAFLEDARRLGLAVVADYDRAGGAAAQERIMPRPTRHIGQFIELIQQLLVRGHAYIGSDGVVYYDVGSFAAYGRLSGNSVEQLSHGAGGRTNESAAKRHPADFFLWKPDRHHLMRWPSPWGEGYPGWHVECSSMAMEILGESLDIHTGGEDNIFPHHECEIAQSEGATGRPFVRLWMHARHLMVEGEKMSKSKGNFFTIRDLMEKGFDPLVIRLALIRTRYRETLNFTLQSLHETAGAMGSLRDLVEKLGGAVGDPGGAGETGPAGPEGGPSTACLEPADADMLAEFQNALDDDLNTSAALAALFTWAAPRFKRKKFTDDEARSSLAALRRVDHVLGVMFKPLQPLAQDTRANVENLLRQRDEARQRKDFATADRLRANLTALGVEVHDTPSGSQWRRRLAPERSTAPGIAAEAARR